MRSRGISPSLVVSCVALFVALGGTSVAATTLITRPAQIKNGVVTSAHIKNGTVASVDVKDGSLTSADIKDGTIKVADLSAAARGAMSGATPSSFVAREVVRKVGPESQAGPSDVVTLQGLEPGTYLITAKATMTSTRADQGLGEIVRSPKTSGAACTLLAGGDQDDARAPILTPYANTPATVNMQLTRTIDAPIDVKLACSASDTTWRASDASIIALRLAGSSRQDVSG
jgi:hypothetical protein